MAAANLLAGAHWSFFLLSSLPSSQGQKRCHSDMLTQGSWTPNEVLCFIGFWADDWQAKSLEIIGKSYNNDSIGDLDCLCREATLRTHIISLTPYSNTRKRHMLTSCECQGRPGLQPLGDFPTMSQLFSVNTWDFVVPESPLTWWFAQYA